jgi:hypothetical protein
MLPPAFNGNVLSAIDLTMVNPSLSIIECCFFIMGLLVCVIFATIFINAMRSIGLCNAGFVPEFVSINIFSLLKEEYTKKFVIPYFGQELCFLLVLQSLLIVKKATT